MNDTVLPVTSIQRFCMHDGDGIRTTVFLKGCPLNCKWCHNPEAKETKSIIMYDERSCISCGACAECRNGCHTYSEGTHLFERKNCIFCTDCTKKCPTGALKTDHTNMTISEITETVMSDLAFYGYNGGVTVSGGEPMLHEKNTIELLQRFKEKGLNTAVETSGYFNEKLLCNLKNTTDTLLWDIKDSDAKRHFENTGVYPYTIINNLKKADALEIPTVLRCIILEGINFTEEHLNFIVELFNTLSFCKGVELIEYHPMGDSKCRMIGSDESFHDKKYIPNTEKLQKAREFIAKAIS